MFPSPIAQAAVTNIKPKRPEKLSREAGLAWYVFKSSIISSQVKHNLDYCLKKLSSYYKPSTPSLFLVFLTLPFYGIILALTIWDYAEFSWILRFYLCPSKNESFLSITLYRENWLSKVLSPNLLSKRNLKGAI